MDVEGGYMLFVSRLLQIFLRSKIENIIIPATSKTKKNSQHFGMNPRLIIIHVHTQVIYHSMNNNDIIKDGIIKIRNDIIRFNQVAIGERIFRT